MNLLMLMSLVLGFGIWYVKIYLARMKTLGIAELPFIDYLRDESVFAMFKTLTFWSVIALLVSLVLARDFLWKFYLRQYKPLPYHIVQEFEFSRSRKRGPVSEGNQVFCGPRSKPRVSRGFSFSQTYGQSKVLEAYNQSPKLVAKSSRLSK